MSSTPIDDGAAAAEPGARGRHRAARSRSRFSALGTRPASLVGSLVARTITAPADATAALHSATDRGRPAPRSLPLEIATADTAGRPSLPDGALEHVVAAGETVSDVAARYGVSTASLLAFNGLAWRSVVTAGDTLRVRPAATAPTTGPVAAEVARHAVLPGEDIASIAASHGVATAAVLLANGLSRDSAVKPGQFLVIPIRSSRRHAATTGEVLSLTGEMASNARAIIDAGYAAGVPEDGVVVALTAAMQDSALRNLECGEFDAIGLFQQRPSHGWGSSSELLDPRGAARRFFGGPSSPVRASAKGLLDVAGWELMAVGEAAHAVQRVSSPAAYAKWEQSARQWLRDLA